MKLRIAVPEHVRALRPAPPADAGGGRRLPAITPQLATLALAAAVAAQLAVLAWKLVAPPAALAPASRATPPRPAFDVARLQAAQLFGAAAPVAGAAAPRTNVPLVLAGTLAGSEPDRGLAIVGENAQSARVYAVGATLPGGVKLHAVYADRVILDRNGALETLPLPRQIAPGTGFAGARRAPAPTAEPALAESVQKLIAAGPEVVGEMVRPMPDFANGQLRGFRLYPGRDRQKFAKLGLQAGDLVTQVNGVPLTDPQRGLEILRGLGAAGQANVTVERGGSVQQITVNAAQVAAISEPGDAPAATPPPTGAPPTRD